MFSAMAHGGVQPAETALAAALSPSYWLRLTSALARRFHVSLTTVLWKLAQPEWPGLACLAEELALRAVIDRAMAQLGPAADFGPFEDEAFADADHEYLFDPRWDGVEGSEAGRALGIGPLGLEACFSVYAGGAYGAVHPYCVDRAPREA